MDHGDPLKASVTTSRAMLSRSDRISNFLIDSGVVAQWAMESQQPSTACRLSYSTSIYENGEARHL